MRIGFGYDSHRFSDGRRLVLGGVEFPGETGLKGHSDADVLVHAVIDALLGAAALGDIGKMFPDNDPETLGISSMKLRGSPPLKKGASTMVDNTDTENSTHITLFFSSDFFLKMS